MKGMTKLTSGVLILRGGNAPEWTSDVDGQFTDWVKRYIEWLETANIAIQEKNSTKCVRFLLPSPPPFSPFSLSPSSSISLVGAN